jgi:hypothetical protein
MTLGALLALGVAAAWLAFAWALLTLFGYLDPPYVEWSILVVLPLAPWLAFRVQRVATEGPRDSTDSFRSPFLPEAPTQALLAQAMKPWDGAQWEELSRQLWKSKEVPAVLEGFRVVLEGAVYPGGYAMTGGNATLGEMLAKEVANGGSIAVVGMLAARPRFFPLIELRARQRRLVLRPSALPAPAPA